MRLKVMSVVVLVAGLGIVSIWAQGPPELPGPDKAHGWLKQLAGEWHGSCEMVMEPGKPSVRYESTEKFRMLGEFWAVGESSGNMGGQPMASIMTLGYDSGRKKYVGTWVDSMTSHLWHYEGSLDATQMTLTLDTEGPDFRSPGKTAKYRDVIQLEGNDRKTLRSQTPSADGTWTTFMTVSYQRKK